MIERKHIAAIKLAQKDACLDDESYRNILMRTAGVSSCKDLQPCDVDEVIQAIKSMAVRKEGWQSKQITKFRQYGKFAGMDLVDLRTFLYDNAGIPNEESTFLKQEHFDKLMAALEAELEFRIAEKRVAMPRGIDISYWRNRRPGLGKINTRERHLINALRQDLAAYLPEGKKDEAYFRGIVEKAVRRRISSIENLSSVEALKVIECLKNKLEAEKKRLGDEVPF